jgi:hypothetical protein
MLSIFHSKLPTKKQVFLLFFGCCAGHAEQCCVYTDLLLLHLIVVGYIRIHNVNGPAPYIYVEYSLWATKLMGDFKAPIGWYINQKRYMYVNCQQLNHSPAQKKWGKKRAGL